MTMWRIANSLWPRSAGDEGNRRMFVGTGPEVPHLSRPLMLPRSQSDEALVSGGVLGDDSELRVVHGDFLSRVALDGTVRWSVSLPALECKVRQLKTSDECEVDGDDGEEEQRTWRSLPTALAGGGTLVSVRHAALIVDADGRLEATMPVLRADNSGVSPAITLRGVPIVTSPLGQVIAWTETGPRALGAFGYDVVPPAVYDDDSLAIAGYAKRGLCRVRLSGEIVWTVQPRDADLLPTIAKSQTCACGSLNDDRSVFVAPNGQQLGEYAHSAVFADNGGGWIAATEKRVARLDSIGNEIWAAAISRSLPWPVFGPIVDRVGRVYVQSEDSWIGLDQSGRRVFSLRIGPLAGPVFPAGEGLFAVVVGGALRLLGDKLTTAGT